jgi:phosphate:Na+ symporter
MYLLVTAVSLAGSVALLLCGIRMVQTGIQRALGARLRGLLATALRNRFSSFFAGIGVTAILQSSTATGLMVTGFAAGGLVDLVPALAVMLGADVGTTLIVQILSFDVAAVAPALVLVGFLLFQRATAGLRDFGRVFIGLGLVLLALHQFIALLTPCETAPALRSILGAISTQPVLDVLLAAALTWAAHSRWPWSFSSCRSPRRGPSHPRRRWRSFSAPISGPPSIPSWKEPRATTLLHAGYLSATC